QLQQRLPDYMIPASILVLDRLPLTPNGKIDRKALPAIDGTPDLATAYQAPDNPVEEILANIWAQVLGVERVGVHDNFFELGGDSILSIRVAAQAQRAGLSCTTKDLFLHQTIAELAGAIEAGGQVIPQSYPEPSGMVALAPAQQWFFNRHEANHWNQSVMIATAQVLDRASLEKAIDAVAGHHSALRTRFIRTPGGWRQRIVDQHESKLQYVDLSQIPESQLQSSIEQAAAAAQATLDIENGPAFRVVLMDAGGSGGRLLMICHHLIVDTVSWSILADHLWRAYTQVLSGAPANLGIRPLSFAGWTEQVGKHTEDEANRQAAKEDWDSTTRDGIPQIPVDFQHGLNSEDSADTLGFELSEEKTRELLNHVSKEQRSSIEDVLLTALSQAFMLWTGQPRLAINLEGHGRDNTLGIDLSQTVGWFTAICPILLECGGSLTDCIHSTRDKVRIARREQIANAPMRESASSNENTPAERLRQPQLSFNYLGQLDEALRSTGSDWRIAPESTGPQHDPRSLRAHLIDITAGIRYQKLNVEFTFSRGLHQPDSIETFSSFYQQSLLDTIHACLLLEGDTASGLDEFGWDRATIASLKELIAD
ncbi:MAG TPA: condensation domain-containing protein, partial [Candidatus Angelobacter sp.]|nr:condensation domain-containing protein [Candidatus Angelobacter sp.]